MKHDYDAGTPELQAQKERAKTMKRKGLDYLMQCRTITQEQYLAGCIYRTFFNAKHCSGYRSCLASNFMPEILGKDPCSEYWEKLMGMADAKTWQGRISGKLAHYSFRARKPYHKIIEHVCGHEDWNLEDVANASGVSKKQTASRYTSAAFDALLKAMAESEKELEEENNLLANGQRGATISPR